MGASNLDVNISEGLRRAKKKKVLNIFGKKIFWEAFDSATTYSISISILWPAEFRPQGST